MMYRRTYAEIDLGALSENWKILGGASGSFLCPMVKANAYGHGDVQVARHLEGLGARRLGVCLIEEGLLLRQFGVRGEILVFRGFDQEGARAMLEHDLTPVVSSWEQIEALEACAKRPVDLHLKFDTGMNRLGFSVADSRKLFERLHRHPLLRIRALLTHLARGEDAHLPDGDSARQLRSLVDAAEPFEGLGLELHALNSAGWLRRLRMGEESLSNSEHPLIAREWGGRPGLAIYGVNPLGDNIEGLRPVMSLKSHAAVLRSVSRGESVSYNGTWTAPRDSVIAVVPIGYADGYHRLLSNRAMALFGGHRVPVVGSVCMDYLMLDVTEVERMSRLPSGERREVVLFGKDSMGGELPVEEVAAHAQTISWEILTSVGERVPRVYHGGSVG